MRRFFNVIGCEWNKERLAINLAATNGGFRLRQAQNQPKTSAAWKNTPYHRRSGSTSWCVRPSVRSVCPFCHQFGTSVSSVISSALLSFLSSLLCVVAPHLQERVTYIRTRLKRAKWRPTDWLIHFKMRFKGLFFLPSLYRRGKCLDTYRNEKVMQ